MWWESINHPPRKEEVPAGASRAQQGRAIGGRADRREHADPGYPGGHDQDRHDPYSPGAAEREHGEPNAPSGSRRACLRDSAS